MRCLPERLFIRVSSGLLSGLTRTPRWFPTGRPQRSAGVRRLPRSRCRHFSSFSDWGACGRIRFCGGFPHPERLCIVENHEVPLSLSLARVPFQRFISRHHGRRHLRRSSESRRISGGMHIHFAEFNSQPQCVPFATNAFARFYARSGCRGWTGTVPCAPRYGTRHGGCFLPIFALRRPRCATERVP